MKNENWFALSVGQIEQKLKTNAAAGLSRKAARSRVGKNEGCVFLLPKTSFLKVLGRLISDFSIVLLLLASFISLFFEEYHTGVTIFVLLLCDISVFFGISLLSTRTAERLALCFYPKMRVIRNGKLFWVDGRSVVPGDVILVEKGDVLCCDARLVYSQDLTVQMRMDVEHYAERKKFAEGFIPTKETRPEELVNMIHAGSVVTAGCGRGIVTATGRYTYLGAKTGGIPVSFSRKRPARVEALYEKCAKYSLIGLAAVLPLCLIGLAVSYTKGGTVLLSSAFLTLLSIIATGVSQLTCSASVAFYTREMKELLGATSPVAVRSVKALETIGGVRYAFLRDGAALSDGIKHFHAAYCDRWEIKDIRSAASHFSKMGEAVALYHMAATETLTTGVGGAFPYDSGIRQFLSAVGVDRDALRIRCRVISYLPGNLNEGGEKVCVLDGGRRIWISVTSAPQSFLSCTYRIGALGKQELPSEEREAMKLVCERALGEHQIPLIFTVLSDNGGDGEVGFVGMLMLKEGIDERRMAHAHALERLGCRVIMFGPKDESPALPFALEGERSISKEELTEGKLPLTHKFGFYQRYSGFDDGDIAELIRFAHRKRESVALITFGECSTDLMKAADILVSFAPSEEGSLSSRRGETVVDEMDDGTSGALCSQAVRQRAEALVPRPIKGRGGLPSLIGAVRAARRSNRSFLGFFRYLMCAQIVRGVAAVLPLLFGRQLIDARHVLFCGLILDTVAFLYFAWGGSIREHSAKDLILSVSATSIIMIGLPYVMELSGWFGPYLYQTEYLFFAMLFLQWSVLLSLCRVRDGNSTLRRMFLWIGGILCVLLLSLFLLSPSTGAWMGVEKHPIPYFLVSILPAVILFLLLNIKGKRTDPSKKKLQEKAR